ncbi:hypothetical protein D3C83_114100 [compost metagenome]
MLISIVRGTLTPVSSQIACGAWALKSFSIGGVTANGEPTSNPPAKKARLRDAISRMITKSMPSR